MPRSGKSSKPRRKRRPKSRGRRFLASSGRFIRGPLWRLYKGIQRRFRRAWRRLKGRDRLLALGLGVFLAVCAWLAWIDEPPVPSHDICDMFLSRPDWFLHARDSERQWGMPMAVQMAFIRHESGFRARIRPPRRKILWILPGPRPSTAFGYSQALDSTWRDYQIRRDRPRARRDRFSDAIDFVGWYGHELSRETGISIHDSHDLYLAYHEGPAGYAAGRHSRKPHVLKAAQRVAATAGTYGSQLTGCEPHLRRRQMAFLVLEVLMITSAVAVPGLVVWRRRKRGNARKKR